MLKVSYPDEPYSSFVFVPHIETFLTITKLVRTKDIFGHSDVESSYLCLLVYVPSRVYNPTVPFCIYNPFVIIRPYVPPIFACMFFFLPLCLLPYLSTQTTLEWVCKKQIKFYLQYFKKLYLE